MTKKLTLIFLVIIAVIIWMLLQKNQEKSNPVQIVSQQNQQITETPEQQTKAKIKTLETEVANHMAEDISQPIENTLKELTYMQLYEKSLVAKDCFGFYLLSENNSYGLSDETKKNEIDYIQDYKNKIERNSKGRQNHATEQQIQSYQDHTVQCTDLKTEIESNTESSDREKESFSFAFEQLRLIMTAKEPISDEGKQLKFVLKEAKAFKNTTWELKKLNAGESDLSKQETNLLKQEIQNLNFKLKSSDYFGKEAKLTPEYLALKKEFDDKQAYLDLHLIINQQELIHHKKILINSIAVLESHLKTEYPLVFNEAFNGLNLNLNSSNRLPHFYKLDRITKTALQIPIISQQIFEQSGIKDKNYFNLLLQPSLDLYQCYLGAECTFPNNRRLTYLCYLPKHDFQETTEGLFFEACEMNIEDFYLQNYLTGNQVEDMNVIFNYLVNNYAK